jgi:hypothetical protein
VNRVVIYLHFKAFPVLTGREVLYWEAPRSYKVMSANHPGRNPVDAETLEAALRDADTFPPMVSFQYVQGKLDAALGSRWFVGAGHAYGIVGSTFDENGVISYLLSGVARSQGRMLTPSPASS